VIKSSQQKIDKTMISVTAIGRLGQDPGVKFLENSSVTEVSLAVDIFDREKTTNWYRLKIWGKRGESFANLARKGSLVAVSGNLVQRLWTNKEGVDKISIEISVSDWKLLGRKSDSIDEDDIVF
jgi:single-strand DNA-binding protein